MDEPPIKDFRDLQVLWQSMCNFTKNDSSSPGTYPGLI